MRLPFKLLAIAFLGLSACQKEESITNVIQWTTHEISLQSAGGYKNGYTDVDVWAEFKNDKGETIKRPAFWDGGNTWKIRFAPPDTSSVWTWQTFASNEDKGLADQRGSLKSIPYPTQNVRNIFYEHGFLKMSSGKRNVVHADGTPFLVIGDTPWAIPFRAKNEQVEIYASDRQGKGFNTALLMSVQPDRYAEGPTSRDSLLGYARAFDDLPNGHLNKLKPEYFQQLDSLISILVSHEIVPVIQPVFHGFGWKGKTVLGTTADPQEYARYCRYLVARYGSKPAFWLVSADGTGLDPGVKPGGEEIEEWDAYQQPTGIHYNPADDYMPVWAQGDSAKCFHYNRSHQSAPWLDFQWAQTGHDGKHIPYKVVRMYDEKPTKAVLNGEPTYEGMGGGKHGLGWWQGEEAWTNLMNGGTMGVVYGAAGLWQWKLTIDEPGWDTWTDQRVSWETALDLEGSRYPGNIGKALKGFDFTDMEKHWDLTEGNKPLLAKEGKFYIAYLPEGGEIKIKSIPDGLSFYWFDPVRGEFASDGEATSNMTFKSRDTKPWVLLIGNRTITGFIK
jgi:hypothetical protein